MNDAKLTLVAQQGAKCAKCLGWLSMAFRRPARTVEIECKICGDKVVAMADANASMSVETFSYPDIEAAIKTFPYLPPRNPARDQAIADACEAVDAAAAARSMSVSVAHARKAVKDELATDKCGDGEKLAASERLRLLAIDMQRADQSDIDNLALHIDRIRKGMAHDEHAAPREEAADEQKKNSFTPFTDTLAEIDAAADAGFGMLLLGVRDAARFELGREDLSLLETANIVGQRGYQIEVASDSIAWVRKRDD